MNGKRMMLAVCVAAAVLTCVGNSARGEDVTTVRITDKVLVEDCPRLGINLGGDAYYSGGVLVKDRVRENFEGTSYRQCHFGPLQDEHGATTWFNPPEQWRKILIGGRYTILSGPAKGITGIIKDITTKQAMNQGQLQDYPYFVFDKEVPAGPPNTGILVEAIRLDEGDFRAFESHDHWTSLQNRVEIGDVHPGAFGVAALNLNAAEQPEAHVRFATHYQRYGESNGTWRFNFWARAKSGQPTLDVIPDRQEWGQKQSVTLTPQWKKYELSLLVNKVPEPTAPEDNPHLTFVMSAKGGQVLVDDVEAWLEGDQNPTAFRDDLVAMLKAYNPGVLRNLQMGGNTLKNTIMPPMQAHAFDSQRSSGVGPYSSHSREPYSLHQMYELCEYIGSEPWYCLPGTLSYQEMKDFMEYLGAPADVGYGKLRAELGHPKPWTEVFTHIHVEFGNEAWNNAGPYQCGGFNGKDYWQDLIETGKTSPYYSPKVLFHTAGQAASSSRNRTIMANSPNADRFGVAPYIVHNLNNADMAMLDTDAKFFRWAFGWPIRRSINPAGEMAQNYNIAGKAGIELSIYEVNHHTTGGDAPLEPRNRLVTSIGGGLNVAGDMLLMLKLHHLRTQALFSLVQHGYRAPAGEVRLWGTALNMRKGQERYRPTFLACSMANKVMGGNLVETVQSGANPTFDATGIYDQRQGVETLTLPCLWTYAFADGKKRGLILLNLDTSRPLPVAVEFSGTVAGAGAHVWLLSADKITANNEFEAGAPQVAIKEADLPGFRSGATSVLPPFSMRVLAWEVQ